MFITKLEKQLDLDNNFSITENGGLGYKTTGKYLLDLNFKVSSFRNSTSEEIIKSFVKAYDEDAKNSIKWLFYARDIREGLGERNLFKIIICYLAENNKEVVKDLIKFIPFYGRFDDILCLLDTKLSELVLSMIKRTLDQDLNALDNDQEVSLLGKWLPSINASSKNTKRLGKIVSGYLGLTEKEYRKALSSLRRYIDVVEVKMCSGRWDEINYKTITSKNNLLYNAAFYKHDEARRSEFIEKVKSGEETVNAGVLMPYEIVSRYKSEYRTDLDSNLEMLWANQKDIVDGNSNTIVVRDGSGSMGTSVGNTTVTAHDVATSLSIYFSERCSGEFKDKFITFSSKPQLVDLSGRDSLLAKLHRANDEWEVSNTDIEAVFKLILDTAINGNMKQEDLPSNILVISDMEFDECKENAEVRIFDKLTQDFKDHGYNMPRLVFWNVCSRSSTIPVIQNELGVALVSGFSVNTFKMVLSDKMDPYEVLLDVLNSERYQPLEDILKEIM